MGLSAGPEAVGRAPTVDGAGAGRIEEERGVAEIVVNGVRLWYEDQGEGSPVLLVGGTSMPAGAWDLTVRPALVEAGHRVVAFDGRGVGRSDAPPPPYSVADLTADAAGLVEGLALAPCHVVGLSLGGFVAEDLLCRRPDLVATAVLVASAGRTTSFTRARVRAEQDLLARGVPLPVSFDQLSVVTIAVPAKVLQDDDATVDSWLALLADGLGHSEAGRRGQFAAERDWLLDDARGGRWPDVSRPCLVVAFEHDLCFPPSRGREAAAAMPRGRFVEIAGVAHGNGPFDAAAALGAAVVAFLAANEPEPPMWAPPPA